MKKKYELDISESGYQVIEINDIGREISLGLFHTREEADKVMNEYIKAEE